MQVQQSGDGVQCIPPESLTLEHENEMRRSVSPPFLKSVFIPTPTMVSIAISEIMQMREKHNRERIVCACKVPFLEAVIL